MKVKANIFIVVALLMAVCAIPAYADIPPLPHAFYGAVEINESPAPAGTQVEARGEGVLTGIERNPIVTTEVGSYGSADPLEANLVVQGDILDGVALTFYVNGVSTEQTAAWHSGLTTELALSVTIAVPAGGGGGVSPFGTVGTNLFGSVADFLINEAGVILEPITATSADGNLTMTIPAGTTALDADGNPLSTLTSAVDVSPPAPPEGANIIELAYNFGPAGATFDPAITFEYTYDPAEVPEGVAEGDLVLAYYDEAAGEWVELPCTVDPITHTITASVSHFTTFAILGYEVAVPPPTPAPEPEPTPAPEPEPTPAPEPEPTPAPEPEPAPPEPVAPPAPEVKPGPNWPMIGGIIAAVAAVSVILFRRRRAA